MLLRVLALAAVVSAELPSVYRRPTFAVNVTSDVPYASTLGKYPTESQVWFIRPTVEVGDGTSNPWES